MKVRQDTNAWPKNEELRSTCQTFIGVPFSVAMSISTVSCVREGGIGLGLGLGLELGNRN